MTILKDRSKYYGSSAGLALNAASHPGRYHPGGAVGEAGRHYEIRPGRQ